MNSLTIMENMTEEPRSDRATLMIKYPNVLPGYVLAAISFLGWLFEIKKVEAFKEALGLVFFISIAGIMYWLWCIFRTHQIMKKLTKGGFPRNPSQAALYFIIPGVNFVWAFLWTSRIARFVNESQRKTKIKAWIPGFAFCFSLTAYFFCFPLFLFGSFLVLAYLIKHIKETVEIDAAGPKELVSNIAQFKIPPRKSIIGIIVKISAVLSLLVLLSLPYMMLSPVYRHGISLVESLEKYKDEGGVYPDSLARLGVEVKYDDIGMRGIRYKTYEEGKQFSLACFVNFPGGFLREVYNSKTKQWQAQK